MRRVLSGDEEECMWFLRLKEYYFSAKNLFILQQKNNSKINVFGVCFSERKKGHGFRIGCVEALANLNARGEKWDHF